LALLGLDSFKIEGRMKGALYVSSVTRAYRQAIDRSADGRFPFQVEPSWMEDVQRVSHRPYTRGDPFSGTQMRTSNVETKISYIQTDTLAGLVRPSPDMDSPLSAGSEGKIYLEARSRLIRGQTLEFLRPDGSNSTHLLDSFEDIKGNRLTQAHPNTWIRFCVDFPVFPFQTVRVSNKIGPARKSGPVESLLNSAEH